LIGPGQEPMNSLTMHPSMTAASVAAQRQQALAAMRPQLAAQARLRAQAAASSRLAWTFFIALNGMIIMRPMEIIPSLANLPLYELNILLCLATAMPAIFNLMRSRFLSFPVNLCAVGMFFAILASTLSKGDFVDAQEQGTEFLKVLIYFVLLLALVDSPARIRQLLAWIVIFAFVLNVVALLSYHHAIDLDTVRPLRELQYQASRHAKPVFVERLQAAGIYGNPNDLSRIIVVALTICLYFLVWEKKPERRVLWGGMMVVFIYALQLTASRGGLLALIAGVVVLLNARFGMKKGAFLLLLLVPALAIFGGRQTDITTNTGTGQLRVKLWSEGLVLLRNSPIFGIGAGRYFHAAGNHAHNSFIEAYVETGFFGGTLFTTAFFLATAALFKFKSQILNFRSPDLANLRPYILSLVIGTIVSQFSSSREYSLPTYMILGIAAAYLAQTDKAVPNVLPRVSPALVVKMMFVSAITLTLAHVYTMFNAHF